MGRRQTPLSSCCCLASPVQSWCARPGCLVEEVFCVRFEIGQQRYTLSGWASKSCSTAVGKWHMSHSQSRKIILANLSFIDRPFSPMLGRTEESGRRREEASNRDGGRYIERGREIHRELHREIRLKLLSQTSQHVATCSPFHISQTTNFENTIIWTSCFQ